MLILARRAKSQALSVIQLLFSPETSPNVQNYAKTRRDTNLQNYVRKNTTYLNSIKTFNEAHITKKGQRTY